MKKTLLFLLAVILLSALSLGCASEKQPKTAAGQAKPAANAASSAEQSAPPSEGKTLVLYYSLTGNTKALAASIQKQVGGDLLEIKTVQPYPADFHAVVEQARKERQTGYLPPIQPIASLAAYDTIYLGYPVWGNTIPQPMATFLSQNNLAGKTVIPFCTHDGYGIGRSFQVIAQYCPDARILPGFDTIGADVASAKAPLSAWLQRIRPRANAAETPITVSWGNTVLSGVLNDSPEAKAFKAKLPQRISMTQYGGREYYGPLAGKISSVSRGQLRFEDGDITYCPQNNTIAIFFAQTDRPNLTMQVIPIGRITADLSAFQSLDRPLQMTFEAAR